MEGTMENTSMDWNVTMGLEEENCTLWNMTCLQADLSDELLNPWVQRLSLHPARWWMEGILLPALATLGIVANSLLLRLFFHKSARPSDWISALLCLTNILLLLTLGLRRVPAALSSPILIHLVILYLPALEKGLTTLMTFMFIIFVGDRHLRQVEFQSRYSWVRPLVFCLAVSILVSLPVPWELRVEQLPREQVEQFVDLGNSTQLTVEVVRRTALWHDSVYRNMVRFLVTLVTSQIATVGVLPVILLHSKDMGKTLGSQSKKKAVVRLGRRMSHVSGRVAGRAADSLLPVICTVFILLSLPSLADLITQILLYRPPTLLPLCSSLSLALLLFLVPLLTILLDPGTRRNLACSQYSTPVPTEEF